MSLGLTEGLIICGSGVVLLALARGGAEILINLFQSLGLTNRNSCILTTAIFGVLAYFIVFKTNIIQAVSWFLGGGLNG